MGTPSSGTITAARPSAKCKTSRSVWTDFRVIRYCLWRECLDDASILSVVRKTSGIWAQGLMLGRPPPNPDSGGVALRLQRFAKLFQEKLQIFLGGQRAHNTDTEDLPGQRTEAASDLNASIVYQAFSNFRLANTFWNAHCVQCRNAKALGNVHAQSHGFYALDERLMATAVPLPSVFNSLLRDNQQRLAQRVKHGNRRGVVVAMRHRRVVMNQLQVEVPTAWRRSATVQEFHRPSRHSHRR